jgi:hypothetical protein
MLILQDCATRRSAPPCTSCHLMSIDTATLSRWLRGGLMKLLHTNRGELSVPGWPTLDASGMQRKRARKCCSANRRHEDGCRKGLPPSDDAVLWPNSFLLKIERHVDRVYRDDECKGQSRKDLFVHTCARQLKSLQVGKRQPHSVLLTPLDPSDR